MHRGVIVGDVEIDRLRKRLAETEATMERIVKQMHLVSSSISHSINEVRASEMLIERLHLFLHIFIAISVLLCFR